MKHLEEVAFRLLYRQAGKAGIKDGYYTFDLIDEIVADPRIAEADLDLATYSKLVGESEWRAILEKHKQ